MTQVAVNKCNEAVFLFFFNIPVHSFIDRSISLCCALFTVDSMLLIKLVKEHVSILSNELRVAH